MIAASVAGSGEALASYHTLRVLLPVGPLTPAQEAVLEISSQADRASVEPVEVEEAAPKVMPGAEEDMAADHGTGGGEEALYAGVAPPSKYASQIENLTDAVTDLQALVQGLETELADERKASTELSAQLVQERQASIAELASARSEAQAAQTEAQATLKLERANLRSAELEIAQLSQLKQDDKTDAGDTDEASLARAALVKQADIANQLKEALASATAAVEEAVAARSAAEANAEERIAAAEERAKSAEERAAAAEETAEQAVVGAQMAEARIAAAEARANAAIRAAARHVNIAEGQKTSDSATIGAAKAVGMSEALAKARAKSSSAAMEAAASADLTTPEGMARLGAAEFGRADLHPLENLEKEDSGIKRDSELAAHVSHMDAGDEFAALRNRVDINAHLLSYQEKLELYGLIMQAEQGDAPAWEENGPPPGCQDLGEERQFTAWHKLRGTSKADAQKRFIDWGSSLAATHGF